LQTNSINLKHTKKNLDNGPLPSSELTMDIKEYIESGILEAYIFGSASKAETEELLRLKAKYPQIKDALNNLELDLERIAQHMAIAPPPGRWCKIEAELNELIKRNESDTLKITGNSKNKDGPDPGPDEAEVVHLIQPTNQIRVHKLWRTLVIALIILGLIFFGVAVYLNSKNKKADQQLQKLKNELKTSNFKH
jgi:septation ring formation regulator EzrA